MKNLTNNDILSIIGKLSDEDQQAILDNATMKNMRELFSNDGETIEKCLDNLLDTAAQYAKLYKAYVHLYDRFKTDHYEK